MSIDAKKVGERLRLARQARGYATKAEAARAFQWNENTYTSAENGNRAPSREAAQRYAAGFRIRLDWLLEGRGPMSSGGGAVPVIGYVGAGAEIFPLDDGAFDPIEPPFAAPEGAVAFRVRGDSQYPAYRNGTIIIAVPTPDPAACINRRAVVTLDDGRRLLKEVAVGATPGHFTLLSHNAPPISDARIVHAAQVIGTVEP